MRAWAPQILGVFVLGLVLCALHPVLGIIAWGIGGLALASSIYEDDRADRGLPAFHYDGSASNLPEFKAAGPAPALDLGAPAFEPVVAAAGWGGVFVETGPASMVLCLFPVADDQAFGELDTAQRSVGLIEAALVFGGEGLSAADKAIDVFGVPADRVFRADEDALPEELAIGELTLTWAAPTKLKALWRRGGARHTGLIGSALSYKDLSAHKPNTTIGWFREPEPGDTDDLIDFVIKGPRLVLIDGDGHSVADARFLSTIGAHVTLVHGETASEDPVRLLMRAALDGDETLLADRMVKATPEDAEQACQELLVLGEYAAYERVIAAALAQHPADSALLLQRAIGTLMQGDEDKALADYRAAAEAGAPEAYCSIAALLAREGKFEEALVAVAEGRRALPDDPLTAQTEAHVLLALENGAPDRFVHRFPLHAERSLAVGLKLIELGRPAEALRPVERAAELDPLSPTILAELERVRAMQ